LFASDESLEASLDRHPDPLLEPLPLPRLADPSSGRINPPARSPAAGQALLTATRVVDEKLARIYDWVCTYLKERPGTLVV